MAQFTVDTHLFRELGELLVGRDSTALVELIKNAYDADATKVTVHAESLDNPASGSIIVIDDGNGMTRAQFEQGFLRIASRLKDRGDKRSARFKRRFTGAKGVGRLAAHKLAKAMRIVSVPQPALVRRARERLSAFIDWAAVERCETLQEVAGSDAIQINHRKVTTKSSPGTRIELSGLRRRWSPAERGRFFWEVQTFQPPQFLTEFPESLVEFPLLFRRVRLADARRKDPGIDVELSGDFDAGEEYWSPLAESASWVLEIEARKDGTVVYLLTPTQRCLEATPEATQRRYEIEHPDHRNGPFFHARVLIREGTGGIKKAQRVWIGRASGIRVYMEGFRVLPYGEAGNDWLEIDADYVKRERSLGFLKHVPTGDDPPDDPDAGLMFLRKDAYFGAVFLTQDNARQLRPVVNREGFVPEESYYHLVELLRTGVYLSVRVRALARQTARTERRQVRLESRDKAKSTERIELRRAVEEAAKRAIVLAKTARQAASQGDLKRAERHISRAAAEFSRSAEVTQRLLTERSMMQILASVGLQMSSFVHEINGLLGMAQSLESAIARIRKRLQLDPQARRTLGKLLSTVGDLRRVVEKQASYLTDITSPDARRRRSRQRLAERFDAAAALVAQAADSRNITIVNKINPEHKSMPMFPAELTLVFSNLLTNAVKAARKDGRIRATSRKKLDGQITVRIENTGRRVGLRTAERWFQPFESTSTSVDPTLGQGMGMGLPITRNMLEEYGAEIRFCGPRTGFATALEIVFP